MKALSKALLAATALDAVAGFGVIGTLSRSRIVGHASVTPVMSRLRGGNVGMSSVAAVEEAPVVEKFRKDYQAPPYRIESLKLNFIINEDETLVDSALSIEPAASTGAGETMFLDGEELALRSIELDGTALVEEVDYKLTAEGLTLLTPPLAPFTLKTTVAIKPQENTQLSGLYKSSGNFVTQCEAEGFRRITFFQDRPDVMATYEVRVEADKEAYPLLLSNGNEVGSGDL